MLDLDSIVSSIAYAWAISQHRTSNHRGFPVISCPRQDFRLRLDRDYVLTQLGHISPSTLIFIDDPEFDLAGLSRVFADGDRLQVVLMDHPSLSVHDRAIGIRSD